jgi:hypothetical protein
MKTGTYWFYLLPLLFILVWANSHNTVTLADAGPTPTPTLPAPLQVVDQFVQERPLGAKAAPVKKIFNNLIVTTDRSPVIQLRFNRIVDRDNLPIVRVEPAIPMRLTW